MSGAPEAMAESIPLSAAPNEGSGYEVSPSVSALVAPASVAASAFHDMAAEIIQRHLRLGRRGFTVCGASSGTGVTFTAVNLAAALSRAGIGTLLIDANLRAPALDRFIRPPRETPGLQQVLASHLGLASAVHREVAPNLSLLYAGGPAAAPGELLLSERTQHILSGCLRDYECTVVDTAPTNRSADALSVAAAVGYSVIVGRKIHSYLDDAAFLSQQLRQAGVEVLGAVFNGG